ncbi:MAG TPA: peptidyl-alpha-hydroxyglycine alpha-amidating lyase family protein [Vicinamibacterales bacterium]|nr:peptidyl-alpha-hydroxyglycine alpha-amidating lyase family protein [Vicinamibacterales bacterium]
MTDRRPIVTALVAGALLFSSTSLRAQRPSDPALLVPQRAPALDYVAVPDPLPIPAGMTMGAPASVAFDADGHLFVLTRGTHALYEFDPNGRFVRAFGEGLLARSHGIDIDRDGNIWVTDVSDHVVLKLNHQGQVLMTLGVKGQAGEWNEAAGSRRLNQPTDVEVASNGDVFVVQGHTPGAMGDPRVLKFDRTGKFVKSWGGKGKEPGKFDVAHGIAIDAKGLLWVADRENQRVQIFDADGTFVRELKYAGVPCALDIGDRYIYMVNGFAGQLLRLDLQGEVLAATGKEGKGLGEFGEAHFVAVSPKGDIFVADSVNATVQKFVQK